MWQLSLGLAIPTERAGYFYLDFPLGEIERASRWKLSGPPAPCRRCWALITSLLRRLSIGRRGWSLALPLILIGWLFAAANRRTCYSGIRRFLYEGDLRSLVSELSVLSCNCVHPISYPHTRLVRGIGMRRLGVQLEIGKHDFEELVDKLLDGNLIPQWLCQVCLP